MTNPPLSTFELLLTDPYAAARKSADVVAALSGELHHDVAVILGSGFGDMVPSLGQVTAQFPAAELADFLAPSVEGHAGLVQSVKIGDKRVLIFVGRKHLYEEYDNPSIPVAATVHAVRVAAAAGCKSILLTNAVGGTSAFYPVGTAMLIRDHFSLLVPSPLSGPRFLQCREVYSRRLRGLCNKLGLPEGIYAQIRGPHFESPFEYAVLRQLGVDVVGMSIATEALAARDMGMEVLAISCITDVAGQEISHQDVLAVVRQTAAKLGPGLAEVLKQM